MEKKLMLLGPPGSGKSTIIRASLEQSMRAVDFEALWHIDGDDELSPGGLGKRRDILSLLGSGEGRLLVGGAGFQPDDAASSGFETALLFLQEQAYRGRRLRRDTRDPDKAGQAEHSMADWFDKWHGDFVLDASLRLELLVSALREYYNSGDPSDIEPILYKSMETTPDEQASRAGGLDLPDQEQAGQSLPLEKQPNDYL